MHFTIEQATAEDLDAILRLNEALFDFEKQFTDKWNFQWTYSAAGKAYFSGRLKQEHALCLIAKDADMAIGYLVAYTESFSYRSSNPITELENMYVLEKYRHLGVGSALIKEVKKLAKNRGSKYIRVEAITQNAQAIAFYKKAGFTEFNTILETVI